MAEYFFELLTEEIPAWMHEGATATLNERLSKLVSELGVTGEGCVKVSTTPRRIVFLLSRLPLREEDREQEVKGPPRSAAFDAAGEATPALKGFLKKQNATAADILETQDEYVRIRKTISGRETGDILRDRIPQIIESIRWPKMMRIGSGEHTYVRPVHSVVSIFEEEHLPVVIFGIESGMSTVGHRTLAPQQINVKSFSDYVSKLELARVVVDAARRREVMIHRARTLALQVGGTPSADAAIWSEWQYLTEYPGLVRAEFRRDYLALPEEVLVTVMRVHQKQLPILDREEHLTPYFLAVLDNDEDRDGNAAYGNSFVTNARFADAQFFYESDRRVRLEERLESLSHLQFQEVLGNYLEKTRRIETIAAAICSQAEIETEEVAVASRLCKSDLVTEMVKEFTELQGRVGGIYAREEGYEAGVWQAIYDHYQPVSIEDSLPRNVTGAVISLADKIDTVAGFFLIGAKPTGSRDPFGLRRAAQGIVQILLNRDKREVRIGIDRLIDIALAAHTPSDTAEQIRTDLLAFFAERVRTILETSAWKFEYDEIAAAMEAGWAASLTDLVDRVTALKSMRNEANFLSILDSAKRIANITAGQDAGTVDPARLEHPTEQRLAGLAGVVTAQISEMVTERQYRSALESFAAMAPELETFFNDVLVMVEDEALKRNRMALLRMVGGAVMRIADVTKIVVDRREYRA
jgi:glycyl-tRNA synthetase beta chain